MTSLTDLGEVVDVVIGVDTHVHTHSAAVVDTRTGGVLDEITIQADRAGVCTSWWSSLTSMRCCGCGRWRAPAVTAPGWPAIWPTRDEVVIELDRPERARRRHGAKSDPLDAIRAAREALSRPNLGTPLRGGRRQALSVLLAARRSAVQAATIAQRQLFSLVIAAPEPLRARFRERSLTRDGRHRGTDASPPVLGRRDHHHADGPAHPWPAAPRPWPPKQTEHQRAITVIVNDWRPDLLSPARSRPDRGRHHLVRLVPPRPDPLRGRLRHARRSRPHPRIQRTDHPPPAELATATASSIEHSTPSPCPASARTNATRDYIARRTTEGKTTREIKRCLKRYIARNIYRLLEHNPKHALTQHRSVGANAPPQPAGLRQPAGSSSAEDAGALGVEEGLQGDPGRDPGAGDVDLERSGGQGGGRDRFVALDAGDTAGSAEGVAEAAAADVADGVAVPVDRLVAVEVMVGRG